jgi:4'-phosphopantetheinyl transferase
MNHAHFHALKRSEGLAIANSEVHLWLAALDAWDARVSLWSRVLSEEEFSRAQRFCFDTDRNRFIIRRGLLRKILSLYLGIAPEGIQFNYGIYGKPYLSQELGLGDLQFSISHSDGLALYAFTRNRRIGIDLEVIKELPDLEHMAECLFSPEESALLRRLAPNLQKQRFFHWWTCKEAYLKATGEGLTYPLSLVNISLDPAKPPQFLNPGSLSKDHKWSLKVLSPTPTSVAALAVEGREYCLNYRFWQPSIQE